MSHDPRPSDDQQTAEAGGDDDSPLALPRVVTTRVVGQTLAMAQDLAEFLIAPELDEADATLYVLCERMAPSEFGATVAGYTHPTLDLAVRDQIDKWHPQGWRGRGPAIVINERMIHKFCPNPFDFRHRFLSTAIHELAHVCERSPMVETRYPPAVAVEHLEEQLDKRYISPADQGLPAFHLHELQFFRALLHLKYRANRANYALLCSIGGAFSSHGLSDAELYWNALGDEAELLFCAGLGNVMQTDPPAALVELFKSDSERLISKVVQTRRERQSANSDSNAGSGKFVGPGRERGQAAAASR